MRHICTLIDTFLITITNFPLEQIFLDFSGLEPKIILKLFINLKGVSENERNVFKSLSKFYFITTQIKGGTE